MTNDGGQEQALRIRFVGPIGGKLSGVEIDCSLHGSPFPKGASKIDGEVRLTDEQAALCRTVLCQELMKVSNLLGSGKDCNGRKLIDQTKQFTDCL